MPNRPPAKSPILPTAEQQIAEIRGLPGLWTWHNGSLLNPEGDTAIRLSNFPDEYREEADVALLRRIAACLNFCNGMTLEEIEQELK